MAHGARLSWRMVQLYHGAWRSSIMGKLAFRRVHPASFSSSVLDGVSCCTVVQEACRASSGGLVLVVFRISPQRCSVSLNKCISAQTRPHSLRPILAAAAADAAVALAASHIRLFLTS